MEEGAASQLPNSHVKSIYFKIPAWSCCRQFQVESFAFKNLEFG
jgi:hypothetical protein